MKYISLLGIAAIVMLALNIVFSFQNEFEDFQEGIQDGMNDAERTIAIHDGKGYDADQHIHPLRVAVTVVPIQEKRDSLDIRHTDRTIRTPYHVSEVTCRIESTPLISVTMALTGLFALAAILYGIYSLIRVLVCISRKEIFSRRNVWWLRWVAYSLTGVSLWELALNGLIERSAIEQIILPGYEVTGIVATPTSWSSIILIILLTEIYAAAVKIKEEQDLTI